MDRATGLLLISMVDDKEIDPAVRTLLLSSLRHSGYEVEDMLIHAPGRRPPQLSTRWPRSGAPIFW